MMLLLTLLTAMACAPSHAGSVSAVPLRFSGALGSSMVLQRAPLRARVFGNAAPNASLLVELVSSAYSFSARVESDASGEWACELPPQNASASVSYNVSVAYNAAHERTVLTDVVFGDVYVCSGQSNMEEPLSVVNNATMELAAATEFAETIRLAVVAQDSSNVPLRDFKLALTLPWQRASAAALGAQNHRSWRYFSATCWLTASRVSAALGPDVPLGLIGSYVGGTPIESWTPGLDPNSTDAQGHKSAVLFNAMIAPLTRLAVRALLWYQGENNSFKLGGRWIKYATDFPTMIALWRQAWVNGTGQPAHGSTPFGFVQIGPRDCFADTDHQGPEGTFYGGVRWSQTAFQYRVPNHKMPHTFMAVAADLAEGYSPVLPPAAGCVHFGNKQVVGERLALGIRKVVYGHAVAAEGPTVVGLAVTDADLLVVSFRDEAGGPLQIRNASGFELSANGVDYIAAPIVAGVGESLSVTLAIPPLVGRAVASIRYILHDTPCVNQTCAIYSAASGLPSPPLVANLPGHAGADPFGWDMP